MVRNYTNEDGTLKSIPNQMKKLLAVLRYVAKDFQIGKVYSEKEVNAMLEKYHEDYAQLRRELVEFKLMAREGGGGSYWLLEQTDN